MLRRPRGGWLPAIAAASLVLNLGLVGINALMLRGPGQAPAGGLVATGSPGTAAAALAGGSGRVFALSPTPSGRGYGAFRADPSSGQATLLVEGLPPAPAGHVYQGWIHLGSEKISVGTFAPGLEGQRVLTITAVSPTLLGQADGFGITLEPVGGSPKPTGPPLMTG